MFLEMDARWKLISSLIVQWSSLNFRAFSESWKMKIIFPKTDNVITDWLWFLLWLCSLIRCFYESATSQRLTTISPPQEVSYSRCTFPLAEKFPYRLFDFLVISKRFGIGAQQNEEPRKKKQVMWNGFDSAKQQCNLVHFSHSTNELR